MRTATSVGRTVGILLLLQMVSALIFPFVLMRAIAGGYPDFLEAAAASGAQIRTGIGLAFAGAALTLFLGIKMFPVLRQHSLGAALWFLGICAISCGLDAAHNSTVMSMLSVSERFANSGGAEAAVYQAWGAVAASMRRSAHVVQLVAIGAWMMTFYISLWRFRLVPRQLSMVGIVGVASQFTGVTAMMFLGYPSLGYLAMPLAPIHAAAAIWLIAKGLSNGSDGETEFGTA
ncbi:MAG: DUF4386 domain-containing protein [Acidobacteria bacterium]|nr:DUF4386 domain-containing protein [Acidobacteriota bacterium]